MSHDDFFCFCCGSNHNETPNCPFCGMPIGSRPGVEIARLRLLVEHAFREGIKAGWYDLEESTDSLWMASDALKSLTPPTPAPNP